MEYRSAIIITLTGVCFMIYWFVISAQSIRDRLARTYSQTRAAILWFVGNKLLGCILFGLIMTVAVKILYPSWYMYQIGLQLPTAGYLYAIVACVLCIVLSWWKNKKISLTGGDFGRYPELDIPLWSTSTFILHISMWMLYLYAYEWMFRGILLFILSDSLGLPIAIAINCTIYALVHVPKGAGEAFGALVLGFLLCLLTLYSHSFFFAWIIHCALAITNGLSAWYYRSDMGLQTKGAHHG